MNFNKQQHFTKTNDLIRIGIDRSQASTIAHKFVKYGRDTTLSYLSMFPQFDNQINNILTTLEI